MTKRVFKDAAELTPEQRREVMPETTKLVEAMKAQGLTMSEVYFREGEWEYTWRRGKR